MQSTTNGLSNGDAVAEKPQDAPSSPTRTKRKRSEAHEPQPPSTQLFADLLELLNKHDPSSPLLDLELPNASLLASSDGPSTKRPRLGDHHAANTIASRLQNSLYLSLDELEHDIDDACEALLEPVKAKDRLKNGQRIPPDDIKTMQRVSQFKHLTTHFLDRERQKDPSNAIKKEPASHQDASKSNGTKAVLSLFGNAPTPRQLFSSLQQPNTSIDGAHISLEELGLPNMLSATKVVPLQPEHALGTRKANPTFADVFPSPASLPQLNPPKPNKHSSSKSSTISWSTGELPKPSRKATYPLQPLTVGSWVGYGGADSKESVSAIKRRRRESLLNGLDQSKTAEEPSAADLIAQENALFRAAYSSFAPTQDNSKALVAKETKDKVWWHRMGQKRFDKHFVLDPALQDSAFPPELDKSANEVDEQDAAAIAGADELKEIEKAIDEFDEEAFKPGSLDVVSTINEEEREVEQMLDDISQLLQALSSHQRIRNSYMPAGSRNPTSPSPLLSAMMGTSTVPSAEENDTYKALRSQLAQLISKLPPYAVAKLDGEQFEDLAIKKSIVIQGKEYRGTMEEDQLTRMIRNTAAIQAAASATTSQKTDAVPYGRTPSVSSRSAHAPSSYYGARTPAAAPSYGRTSATPQYNAPATAPRQSYANTYNTQANRASFGQSTQQYYQRPGYGAQYGTQTPQPANPARPGYNVPQTAYAPRTTAFANSTATTAQTYTPQNYSTAQQPRPTYGAAATPLPPSQYQPRPAQTYAPQQTSGRVTPTFAQPQNPNTPSAVGPSGFHSTLTSEQQQLMMERQRAQLALQPQARALAAQMGSAQAPQAPMQSNGQGQQQA